MWDYNFDPFFCLLPAAKLTGNCALLWEHHDPILVASDENKAEQRRALEFRANGTVGRMTGALRSTQESFGMTKHALRDNPTALLYGVQSLIDKHAGQHQQEHTEAGAENPHRNSEPVDFHEQFGLLFSHMRARVVEIQLLILVHS